MIDVAKLKYRLVLLDETGKQYDMRDIVSDLSWEENENELSVRLMFKVADITVTEAKGLCKNGRMVFLMAEDGRDEQEVFRGTIKTWQSSYGQNAREITCTSYDLLNQLNKSQDNLHVTSGRTTQAIFAEIAANWGIHIAVYQGPDVVHGKMDFKNKSPAKMMTELLDDAKKKGAGEYLLRAEKGALCVLPVMSNEIIYVFRRGNTIQLTQKENIAQMITRVKVIGQSKQEGSPPVEAVVDGRTEFGILQKIYTRSSDETVEAAKLAAQELIAEDGVPDEEIVLNLPDIPFVRRGDTVYCDDLESADGYYKVLNVSHNCSARTMTLRVCRAAALQLEQEGNKTVSYAAGNEVDFLGGVHYVSSDASANGYTVKGSGPARITKIADGKAHPYHLIHSSSACNVYGWVDAGTFKARGE